MDGLVAVPRVKAIDEARDQVLVLRALVQRGQRRRRELALARVLLGMRLGLAIPALLRVHLILEEGEVEPLQRARAQPILVELFAAADELVALEQVGDAGEAGRVDAEGTEGLEEDEDFKGRVEGRTVCTHPPWLSEVDRVEGQRCSRQAANRSHDHSTGGRCGVTYCKGRSAPVAKSNLGYSRESC